MQLESMNLYFLLQSLYILQSKRGFQVRRHGSPSPATRGCVVEWRQSLRDMYMGCKRTVLHFVFAQVRKSGKSKARLVEASNNWILVPVEALQILNASDASDAKPRVCIGLRRVAKAWTLRGPRPELQSCNCQTAGCFCWDRVLGVVPGNWPPLASSSRALEIRMVSRCFQCPLICRGRIQSTRTGFVEPPIRSCVPARCIILQQPKDRF